MICGIYKIVNVLNGKMFNSKKEICIEFNLTYRQLDRIIKFQSVPHRPS